MKVCAQCGNKLGMMDRVCKKCGCAEFTETKTNLFANVTSKGRTCIYCGSALDLKARFCWSCGKPCDGSISLSFLDEKKEEPAPAAPELDFLKSADDFSAGLGAPVKQEPGPKAPTFVSEQKVNNVHKEQQVQSAPNNPMLAAPSSAQAAPAPAPAPAHVTAGVSNVAPAPVPAQTIPTVQPAPIRNAGPSPAVAAAQALQAQQQAPQVKPQAKAAPQSSTPSHGAPSPAVAAAMALQAKQTPNVAQAAQIAQAAQVARAAQAMHAAQAAQAAQALQSATASNSASPAVQAAIALQAQQAAQAGVTPPVQAAVPVQDVQAEKTGDNNAPGANGGPSPAVAAAMALQAKAVEEANKVNKDNKEEAAAVPVMSSPAVLPLSTDGKKAEPSGATAPVPAISKEQQVAISSVQVPVGLTREESEQKLE